MSESSYPTGKIRQRHSLLRRGLWLAGATVAWNLLEGVIAIALGLAARSVALVGFGVDSFVETASAATVAWRVAQELRGRCLEATEQLERRTARVAGALLLLLAVYIAVEATRRLLGYGEKAESSAAGIMLTAVSLLAMPLLGRAKLKTAEALGSRTLRADAFETLTCAWLSFATLAGLGLNRIFGWAWVDPVAALVLVPLIVREGLEGWRGEECSCGGEK